MFTNHDFASRFCLQNIKKIYSNVHSFNKQLHYQNLSNIKHSTKKTSTLLIILTHFCYFFQPTYLSFGTELKSSSPENIIYVEIKFCMQIMQDENSLKNASVQSFFWVREFGVSIKYPHIMFLKQLIED